MIKNYTKTPISRRIFFWTLALSCVSIVSIVVFFSIGYRFNFASNIFIYSGSINVKATPSNIVATIDNKKPENRHFNFINNSYHITGMRYGIHKVKFSAPGYSDWEKDVEVHSGLATEFWNVILIKNDYERNAYNVYNPKSIFLAPRYKLLAYVKSTDDNQLLIPILNTQNNKVESIIKDSKSMFNEEANENIEWSPDTFTLLVPITKNLIVKKQNLADEDNVDTKLTKKQKISKKPVADYLVISRIDDFKTKKKYLSDILPDKFFISKKQNISHKVLKIKETEEENNVSQINNIFPKIKYLRFHPKKESLVYGIINNDLYLIDISDSQISKTDRVTKLAKNILTYDIADDGIYAMTNQGTILYDENYDLSNPKTLTAFSDINPNTKHTLIAYNKDKILHLSKDTGTLTIFNKDGKNITTKILRSNIENARFSNDGKKIVYNDKNSIYLYMTRDWIQPHREKNTEYFITKIDKNINSVEWLNDYEHVIVGVDNELLLVDLDQRFTPLQRNIISNSFNNKVFTYSNTTNKIYFIDKIDNGTQLFSIYFPEKNKGLFQ